MIEISNLPIQLLRRRSDARSLNDEAVSALADSIAHIGLINPLRVRSTGDGFYEVVAGSHRFAACEKAGITSIACIITADDDVHAEMAMIAENLHRAELSKLERDEQVARWVELSTQKSDVDEDFEAFYAAVSENDAGTGLSEPASNAPERVLAQPAPKPQGGRPEGGIRAASRELGIDRDDARRAVKVAGLSDEAKTIAREIGLDDNRTALLDAAKHDTPEAQVKALQERKQGGIAGRVEEKPGPTYDDLRSAILLLADLKPEDFSRLCPPNKRAAMCQKLAHLEQVFGQVREAVSA